MFSFRQNIIKPKQKPRIFSISPIWAPPSFDLSKALEQALVSENDAISSGKAPARQSSQVESIDATKNAEQATSNSITSPQIDSNVQPMETACEEGEIDDTGPSINTNIDSNIGDSQRDFENGTLRKSQDKPKRSRANIRRTRRRQQESAKEFAMLGEQLKLELPIASGSDGSSSVLQPQVQEPPKVDLGLSPPPLMSFEFETSNERSQKDLDTGAALTLDDLKAEGYRVVEYIYGTPQPLVDFHSKKVFGVVVGMITHDQNSAFDESVTKAFEFLEQITGTANVAFTSEDSLGYGVVYNEALNEPQWMTRDVHHAHLMQTILSNPDIKRIALFPNYTFAKWAPNLFGYYHKQISLLHTHFPHLKWPFYHSIWLNATFHFDSIVNPNNISSPSPSQLDQYTSHFTSGWAALTPLGHFNHHTGGHIVLHDLKIAIELPAGATLLLPTALLKNSLAPIGVDSEKGERRASFVQFCDRRLFRYVENMDGMRSSNDSEGERVVKACDLQLGAKRDLGMALWSTMEDLLVPAALDG
ncbi:hypothetical protein CVT24_000593 [Panaeolus cyanescens]|uniref:Uncharacterized protein n=1 Tax=Panaeolus cyanescens TaxID=181874 RepID=A0A409YDJ6_9AGAR|nr:hypothetical protein CVT24_000593 [Panaeolus cyanescens]